MSTEMSEEKYVSLNAPDKATRVAHLGWRALYTLVAWVILGLGQLPGQGFFVSTVLFATPLLMDYLKFVPDTRMRKYIRNAGIVISGFWFVVGLIGAFGVLSVVETSGGLYAKISSNFLVLKGENFSLEGIWLLMFASVFLAFIDWPLFESELEKVVSRSTSTEISAGQ